MKMRHVTIQTQEFEKELEFYQKYAGLTVQRRMVNAGSNMAFLADKEGDTEIEIIGVFGALDSGNENLSIGFGTEDLDGIYQRLKDDGFEPSDFSTPNPSVRFFFVKDPAGVRVQFIV